MAIKFPPPPQFAGPQWQQLNRWLIELQSILSNQGGIDPSEVAGLSDTIAQVATNTTDIATLESGQGGQGAAITILQGDVTTINSEIATINGQITTLESNPVVRNGVGAPNSGLGSVNDYFVDTSAKHLYVKTGVATWTLIV